ncbi:hypothetical protein [Bacillus sp. Marseille-Q3570]|uniref:hypothetical protein n=1 Tax=Bacillus sp. Marseille-Q3570 TaxID=2963522 RepID=UPI0021B7AD46|nr:hypothetical protein [Bacillus sp. Marseille-Q3570]
MKQIISGIILILVSVVGFNWWDTLLSSTKIHEAQSTLFFYSVPYILSFMLAIIGVSSITYGMGSYKKERSDFEETA